MPDIAALNLAIRSDDVKQATVELNAMTKASSASERAAQKWGMATSAAARSTDDFSKRVQGTIKSLDFERQQLTRSTAEREKFTAIRRAGVSVMSAEGQAIAASVIALQAQRAATKAAGESHGVAAVATKAGTFALGELRGVLGPLAAAYTVAAVAEKAWAAGMKAADLPDQAEQLNVLVQQLQAYRFVAAQSGVSTEQFDQALTQLNNSLGSASKGGKDQIETFEKLGVKILDANGKLRMTQDVLPEVAAGLLKMSSSTERNAVAADLFGKSGSKLVTMLETLAQGNDEVTKSAIKQGAVLNAEQIDAWKKLKDQLTLSAAQAETTFAKLGAPIALEGLKQFNSYLATVKDAIMKVGEAWNWLTGTVSASGMQKKVDALNDDIAAFIERGHGANSAAVQEIIARRDALVGQLNQPVQTMPPVVVTGTGDTGGKSNPTPKGGGGAASDPYAKAIESAREYIIAKNAETAAVGLSIDAAARLKHETELLNKVQTDGKVATAAQKVEIAGLAAAMAAADAAFAHAKFMDDFNKASQQAIQTQQIEYDTLLMSTEAAMAYRLEHEALNDARAKGITLQTEDIAKIREGATAQAAATEKTRQAKELVDLGKEAFTGFFTDMATGLREGANAWETFGNAATNVLNKIADKLISMAVEDLFNQAFGGSKGASGSGGGILSSVLGWLGIGGSSSASAGLGGGSGVTFANGAAFQAGNVIPFARGGVVHKPTLFPMANGMGLMGEAGPEGVMPLRRGRNGRLGVDASGSGGGTVVIINNNAEGTKATARESKGPGGQMQVDVLVEAVEAKMSGRVSRGQGSLGKTMEGTYGLQRQGR